MRIRANELLELAMRYSAWQYAQGAEILDYDVGVIDSLYKDYADYAEAIGLNQDEAQQIAWHAVNNIADLKTMGEEHVNFE